MSDSSFASKYGLEPFLYRDVKIENTFLPVRLKNRLPTLGIKTVADLLLLSPEVILRIKGLGQGSEIQLEKYFDSLVAGLRNMPVLPAVIEKRKEISVLKEASSNVRELLLSYAYKIACGDFSCFMGLDLSDSDQAVIDKYIISQNDLGEEFSLQAIYNREAIEPIIGALRDFNKQYSPNISQLSQLYYSVPEARKIQVAYFYIDAFTENEKDRKILKKYCKKNESIDTLFSHITEKSNLPPYDVVVFNRFLSWLCFSIDNELELLSKSVFSKPLYEEVIRLRAEKRSLQEIGDRFDLSRERVRQLENKVLRAFYTFYRGHRLLSMICALRNGDTVLTNSELEDYFGDITPSISYLLSHLENPCDFVYEQRTGYFLIGDSSSTDQLYKALDSLPDVFNAKQYHDIVHKVCRLHDVPIELLDRAVAESYSITGNTYHRIRLTRRNVYREIVTKYYPNGMHIYDPIELRNFRELVRKEYGITDLPENDHAISAPLSDIMITCGRGIYCLRKENYIPKSLKKRIENYIDLSPNVIIPTVAIFNEFHKELIKAGIDNRYYLHGILREYFDDKYFFKRDYVLKDASVTSMYNEIIRFIRESTVPVSKQEILDRFKVSEITVLLAADDEQVINYFGEYLHASRLNIFPQEKDWLKKYLYQLVSDHVEHHVKDIFDELTAEQPEFMGRNGIMLPFSLFSVLQYLFSDLFQFERPYIAANDVVIGRSHERVKEYVEDSVEIQIEDLFEYAKEVSFNIYSRLDFLNEFSDTHFFKNKSSLIQIVSTGLSEADIPAIEDQILAELNGGNKRIVDLECVHHFKRISVPWNEWLLYSALRKWSTRLSVGTTSSQLRYATPVVAPQGFLDVTGFTATQEDTSTILQPDDLDNIDDLIADYIFDEM